MFSHPSVKWPSMRFFFGSMIVGIMSMFFASVSMISPAFAAGEVGNEIDPEPYGYDDAAVSEWCYYAQGKSSLKENYIKY